MGAVNMTVKGRFNNEVLFSYRKTPRLFFSGIGNEAGRTINEQVAAHKTLGWDAIDLRTVKDTDGEMRNIVEVSDTCFDNVCRVLGNAKMSVPCFVSAVANQRRPLTGDLGLDISDLEKAIPRMRRLNTPSIRVMTWNQGEMPDDEARGLVIEKMKRLVSIAEQAGIMLLHENCNVWGGKSPENAVDLVESVGSPNLGLIFDNGNPVELGQDPLDFLKRTVQYTHYVHIKDPIPSPAGVMTYTFPGSGRGQVANALELLFKLGYQGGICLDPNFSAFGNKVPKCTLLLFYLLAGGMLTDLVAAKN